MLLEQIQVVFLFGLLGGCFSLVGEWFGVLLCVLGGVLLYQLFVFCVCVFLRLF